MSDTFLAQLMQFALRASGAERGMAVNADGEIVALQHLDEADALAPAFTGMLNIQQAHELGEKPHITNNMILDPDMAPNTNTNFANLRLVVVFTVAPYGSVYIDQHVRHGVVNQEVAVQVQQLAETWASAGELHLTAEDMLAKLPD